MRQMSEDVTLAAFPEQELVNMLASALQQSEAAFSMTDLFAIMSMMVIAMVALWRFVIQPARTKNGNGGTKDVQLANRAHALIVKEDRDGVPHILSIPKTLKEFTKVMQQLANHNMERLEEIQKDIRNNVRKD